MEKIGVISKVNNSAWASPRVYIKKKNQKIRVSANFSIGLNDCLKDDVYPLPSPEDIFTKLNGGRVFSKLDLSESYLQVKVSEECSKYLTINTHKGIFKLNHLSFGLKVAPSLFQQIMDTLLAGMEYAIAYLVDIWIKSVNKDQHKTDIRAVFQRIEEYSFKLGAEKCELFMKKIKYLGQTTDSDRRKHDQERAEAMKICQHLIMWLKSRRSRD